MDWPTIFGIVGGIVGIAGAIVAVRNARTSAKKSEVDAQSVIIADLTAAYDRLVHENQKLRRALNTLQAEYATLKLQYKHVSAWATHRGYKLPASADDG
jgi:hypothetical protein